MLKALYGEQTMVILNAWVDEVEAADVRVRRFLWYRCDRERPLGSGMLPVVSFRTMLF